MSLRWPQTVAQLLAACGFAGVGFVVLLSAVAQAAPIDGQIVTGAASISQSGTTTTIQQSSQNLSLTWEGFNIAAQETVNFQQPSASAIAVNRIFDINGTKILGHLNANGQVYLINPNGILFGQGAQLNVGGLVASTLDLNEATLNSNVRSFSGTGSGSIVNQGTINAASGGYVALLGNQVSNQGVITAQLGSVALGAGSAATLTFNGNALVSMQIDQSTLNSLAENKQLIRADGGQVLMTAGAKDTLLASVVNNTGVIEARTVENRNGTIILLGGMDAGQANVAGTLDASAPNGGNGGFIETSAAHVKVANDTKVTTAAPNGDAGTWLIDPVDFTIAAAGGDMTGSTLSTNLGGGNVSIQSSSGATGTAGDVNVNDTVTWSANKLTLNAQNNININADMTATATASLALEYGQGALAAGNTSDIVTTGAAVNLPAGTANFTTRQGSDGVLKNYTVITTLGAAGSTTTTDLQGMEGGLALNYVLGSNIDASATSAWNAGAGFLPVGTFSGTFDGLGHSISGLTINRTTTQYVGLFGDTALGAEIRNLGMIDGSISGWTRVGGLVGWAAGTRISNSYATGRVSGTDTYVGGLVGLVGGTSTISNSYATGNVSGTTWLGGLVGQLGASTISNSYATGTVSGTGNSVGGLVGWANTGTISNSYATGSASGVNSVGGLVGLQNNSSSVTGSYATGSVSGTNNGAGGLVGKLDASTISNSYATGSASGVDNVGGLVGNHATSSTISNSYATGAVSGTTNAGGLVGRQAASTISNSFWDTTTSGQATSAGEGVGAATGMVTADMQAQANFTSATAANGSVDPAWDFTNTWVMTEGATYPRLQSLTTLLTVTANNDARTYDALAYSGGNGVTYNGFIDNDTSAALGGTVAYSGTSQGAVNAGGYVITPDGLTSSKYLFSYADGSLTVNPASLTASITAPDKVYDGTTTATPTFSITAGLIGSETVTATGSATFNTKDVLTANLVTANSNTLADGSNGGLASNYSLATGQSVAASITPASLTASITAPDKVYDGTTTATPTFSITAGLIGSETVTATGSATFNTKDVLTANLVTANSNTLADGSNGGLASNYSLATGQSVAASITPASLTLSGITASNKVYDGTTAATVVTAGAVYTGLITGDAVTVNATGLFVDKNVGTGKLVTLTSSYTGLDVSNYSITDQVSTTADITGNVMSFVLPQSVNNAIAQLNTQPDVVSSSSSGDPWSRLQALSSPLIVKYHPAPNGATEGMNGEGSGATLIILNGGISLSDDKD
ncbi:beta strand repeat-containing protein [Pseudomonadota bacterium]